MCVYNYAGLHIGTERHHPVKWRHTVSMADWLAAQSSSHCHREFGKLMQATSGILLPTGTPSHDSGRSSRSGFHLPNLDIKLLTASTGYGATSTPTTHAVGASSRVLNKHLMIQLKESWQAHGSQENGSVTLMPGAGYATAPMQALQQQLVEQQR